MSKSSKNRRTLLLDALSAGAVDVDDLAQQFDVSPSTVRRDLQRLSSEKAVLRTYGGAILANHPTETTLDERLLVHDAEKRAIARAALDLISDGDTLILDAGSTVAGLGPLLSGRRLTIITNNIALLPLLPRETGIKLIVLGGSLLTSSMSTVGPLAVESMSRMTADRVFMSADGVVAGRGLCEGSLDQVALKSLMMLQAREVVVLADASKLGRAERSAWATLPPDWTLVTNDTASGEQKRLLKAAGAKLRFPSRL